MPVSAARAAAFDILLRVERESSYAAELLHSAQYEKLSTPDHSLATELVMGVLRWRSKLDADIAQASSQPLKKLDLEILIALRLAVYQLGCLTRIPAHAALHESVELVKRARKRSAASFVNAVLRKLSKGTVGAPLLAGVTRSGDIREHELKIPQEVKDLSPQVLAESHAHPLWLTERWTNQYGPEAAQKICQHNQSIPQTALRLRSPEAEGELAAEGISLVPGNLLSSGRRIASGDVTQTETFRRGHVVIQDEASQLVAALIGPGHDQILDCCAAPGGKTLAIVDQNPGATVTAVEIHPHRARLMRKLFGKDAHRIRILIADTRFLPLTQQFDRILIDVPCSGTGTLARNPEIKWRLTLNDLPQLQNRQLAVLRSAVQHLKPGARAVYSTCSLEKEENEDVVEQLLKEDGSLQLRVCREVLDQLKQTGALRWPEPGSLTQGPYLRTIPGVHPCDGFFAALIERS